MFGATLATEKLVKRDGRTVDRGTLRHWLLAAGLEPGTPSLKDDVV